MTQYNAIIIGGGFYGCAIAIYLSGIKNFKKILIIEQESKLMQRASYTNQARVHNGYHYPRSFTTAYRSRVNLPKFVNAWPECIVDTFIKLYAIPRLGSKVTAKQFSRFCKEIGAEISNAADSHKLLFNNRRIESVYQVKEYAFNATILAKNCLDELNKKNIAINFNETVTQFADINGDCRVITDKSEYSSNYVFNCTYAGIAHIAGFPATGANIKQEITEMALVKMPENLQNIGVTIMDGPFFSAMPFPSKHLHSLSHVRYTPHMSWQDASDISPYKQLSVYRKETRVDRMLRDACRYMPSLESCQYKESLYEVKTILKNNEIDDGRPILYVRHKDAPSCFSILGGKIDNIFDVYERLNNEVF